MQLATCPTHPTRQIDTICYYSRCQQTQQQLLCIECALSDSNHRSHPQYVEALHPTSQTFRMLSSIQLTNCRDKLLEELSRSNQFVMEIETSIVDCLRQWKSARIAKLSCLINSLDQSSIPKIINNIQELSGSHSSCCLGVLNLVHDLQDNPQIKHDVREVIFEEIKRAIMALMTKAVNVRQIFNGMMVSEKYQECLIEDNGSRTQLDEIMTSLGETISLLLKKNHRPQRAQAGQDKNHQGLQSQELVQIECDKKKMHEAIEMMKEREEKKKRSYVKDLVDLFDSTQDGMEHQNMEPEFVRKETKQKEVNKNGMRARKIPNSHQKIPPLTRRRKLRAQQVINLDESFECPTTPDKSTRKTSKKQAKPLASLDLIQPCEQMMIIQEKATEVQVIDNLSQNPEITLLTIRNSAFTEDNAIIRLLKACPQIKGLHIECQHSLTMDFVLNCQVRHFTFAHNYLWVAQKDNLEYFPLKDAHPISQMSIFNKNKGSYSAHNKNDLDLIHSNYTEINIFTLKKEPWIMYDSTLFKLKMVCSNIRILTFTDIRLQKGVKLANVYQSNLSLNTLIFKNCFCHLNSIVNDFSSINEASFQHLQISCKVKDKDSTLTQQSFNKICRLKNISTLILVNLRFKKIDNVLTRKNSSRFFKDLRKLEKLVHLNLYGSDSVTTGTIDELSPNCYETLTTLNLGNTEIKSSASSLISKLVNLRNLNLDYTRLDAGDFLEFMPQLQHLQRLSIEGLNGEFVKNDFKVSPDTRERYGYFHKNTLEKMVKKNLVYANITGCDQLTYYDWRDFQSLRFLVRGKNDPLDETACQTLRINNVNLVRLTQSNRPQPEPDSSFEAHQSQFNNASVPLHDEHVDSDEEERRVGTPITSDHTNRFSMRLQSARNVLEVSPSPEKNCIGCANHSSKNKRSREKEPKKMVNRLKELLSRKIVDKNEPEAKEQ